MDMAKGRRQAEEVIFCKSQRNMGLLTGALLRPSPGIRTKTL